jgi:HD-like signal output (HDOD) protein
MSDERFTKEQLEIIERAKVAPPPPRRTEPCRRYIDVPPVSAEEIEEFVKELESK